MVFHIRQHMGARLIGIFMICSTLASAQIAFKHNQTIPALVDGEALPMPWAGGLNSAQYNTADLDMDGVEDLVVFDRSSNKINTYLAKEGEFSYSPEYEYFFPAALRGWVILRDYDCDGKKDIFTVGDRGVDVYRNVSVETLSWELVFSPLTTKGSSSIINFHVNASDLPAIEDMDGDGDLDIMTFGFTGGGLQFHQNFSVERTGSCGELDLERVTSNWGNFQECGCGTFAFNGEDCPTSGGRQLHVGGKSLLAYDMDDDGDMEIVLGEEDCNTLWLLENRGDRENPVIDDFVLFPNDTHPASIRSFPAAYLIDVDFDGDNDLLVSPYITAQSSFFPSNFEASNRLYTNQTNNDLINFELAQDDFIQDKMIDLGNNTSVAFADEDGDGDFDMFLTSHGQTGSFGSYESRIQLYQNIGSRANPIFELENPDYLAISAARMTNTKIQIVDFNNDNTQDIIINASVSGVYSTYFLSNQSTLRLDFSGQHLQQLTLPIGASDNTFFYDLNGDGLTDLLVGRITGKVDYYENTGSSEVPVFQLETESFYGITDDFTNSNIIITVGDINNDGNDDMITTSSNGEMNIYTDFLRHLDDPQPSLNEVYFNPLTATLSKFRMGVWARPVIVDLYNSGTPVIAFGMAQGGVQILENVESLPPQPGDENIYLTIAPNPGTVFSNNGIMEISTKELLNVRVVSILGKEVLPLQEVSPGAPMTISIESLPSGIYIAIAERNGKILDQAKFVIVD